MIGKSIESIATLTWLSEEKVGDILADPSLQSVMQDIEISSLSNKLSITRLRGANAVIDTIITGVQKIVDDIDPTKWNKNHVELFKLVLREQEKLDKKILDDIQSRINITNNVQVNYVRSETKWLESILESLPARAQESFWREVIELWQKYQSQYTGTRQIIGEVT